MVATAKALEVEEETVTKTTNNNLLLFLQTPGTPELSVLQTV